MSSRHIVIVTEEFDPHADILIVMLREMGQQPIRLHTADFPLQSDLSLTINSQGIDGYIKTHKQDIRIGDIHSIWWRRPSPYNLPPEVSREERRFIHKELDHALYGLWTALDCYWMSFPLNIRKAAYKPGQLAYASELGFEIPNTLITTDPLKARDFYEECNGNIIYKVLSSPLVNPDPQEYLSKPSIDPPKPKLVYTTPIKETQLDMLEKVRLAPCQFQEYIDKQVELRVTIIGDDIFTAEIHSQEHDQTRYDWRHYDVETLMRKADLPADIEEKCYAMTKGYGLNFSAIDLILTPDGRYVFLEINPNGQWMWVQEKVPELKMKEALVSCLLRGKTP